MTTLTETGIVASIAAEALAEARRPQIRELVERALDEHADFFKAKRADDQRSHLSTLFRSHMRSLAADDDAQLSLPGLDLPNAVAVHTDEGTYYVGIEHATWGELQAGRNERVENVERAQARLDRYNQSLKMLRPVMEHSPLMTVGEAIERLTR